LLQCGLVGSELLLVRQDLLGRHRCASTICASAAAAAFGGDLARPLAPLYRSEVGGLGLVEGLAPGYEAGESGLALLLFELDLAPQCAFLNVHHVEAGLRRCGGAGLASVFGLCRLTLAQRAEHRSIFLLLDDPDLVEVAAGAEDLDVVILQQRFFGVVDRLDLLLEVALGGGSVALAGDFAGRWSFTW